MSELSIPARALSTLCFYTPSAHVSPGDALRAHKVTTPDEIPMTVNRGTLFIDGGWVAPSTSSRITVLNAATEDVLGTTPEADVADVDRAVAAARTAVDDSEWSATTPSGVVTLWAWSASPGLTCALGV